VDVAQMMVLYVLTLYSKFLLLLEWNCCLHLQGDWICFRWMLQVSVCIFYAFSYQL